MAYWPPRSTLPMSFGLPGAFSTVHLSFACPATAHLSLLVQAYPPSTMPKPRWPRAEADNLLPWLSRHQHLSWKKKSAAYMKEYGIHRSGESLRGKQNQMEDEARQLKGGSFPSSTLHRPSLALRTPNPRVRRLLHQLRRRQHPSFKNSSRKSNQKRFGQLRIIYHSAAMKQGLIDGEMPLGCQQFRICRYQHPRIIACFWKFIHRRAAAGTLKGFRDLCLIRPRQMRVWVGF